MAPPPSDKRGAEAGPLIFLIAGEASGDNLAARLMAALKRQTQGRVKFVGVGEATEDLRDFSADEFVEALFEGAAVAVSP